MPFIPTPGHARGIYSASGGGKAPADGNQLCCSGYDFLTVIRHAPALERLSSLQRHQRCYAQGILRLPAARSPDPSTASLSGSVRQLDERPMEEWIRLTPRGGAGSSPAHGAA